MTTETATDDPTAFLADDLSADLPEGYDIKQYEGRSLRKIFGKGYNDVINDKEHFYIVIRGGKGSKKSKTVALMIIMRMMQYPLANTVCIRKSYNALKDSMFTDLLWAMDRLGVTDWWEVRRSPMQLELKHTHQVILFRGLDKAEKLGGLTVRHGYLCWMWIDEFFEITDEEEFLKAQMGLRGYMPPESGLWKQVICTFNPWSEHCWIKKRFFDEPHDNVLAKVTTYKCNEWLGEEDKKRYDELHETNPRMAKIICDGEWGIVEGLVYENWEIKAFDVEELKKDPNVHEAFGLDFGFSVSYTAFVGFLINPVSREIWIYEDSIYKLGMTNLDIAKAICELGYGDKRIVADCAQPKNIYELRAGIPEEYVDEWGDHHVRKWALPNIVASMKGNDSVLNGISRLQSFKMYILPSCQNGIMELSSYYWEKNNEGEYTGRPHKDFDHCLVAGTMVLTDHGEVPIEDIRVGDMVLTHLGYRRVTASGITRPEPADIWRMTCEDGTVLEGTYDHPMITTDGIKYLGELSDTTKVIKWVGQEDLEAPPKRQNVSSMMDMHGSGIPTVPIEATECITDAQGCLDASRSLFTDISGKSSTGLFQRDIKFITSTETPLTMTRPISLVCPSKTTCMSTHSAKNASKNVQNVCAEIPTYRINAESGTNPRKATSGTYNIPKKWQKICNPYNISVSSAEMSFGRNHLVQTNSAPTNASLLLEEHQASMTRTEFVNGVVRHSELTNTRKHAPVQEHAPIRCVTKPSDTISTTELIAQCKLLKVISVENTGRREYVYDLTVEDAHDFFANSLITRNCLDGLRYGAEPYISKAKGKVAEAKGGTTPRSQVVIANNSDEQTTHRRSRRVASSSKVSRL